MKKSLLLVVALLCMASLMAAMAFTSATVTSGASFLVSNTNAALLALEAGDHEAANYTTGSTSNELVIDWAKGKDGNPYGVQSGSIYTWDKLFKVTNNSEKDVKVSINVPIESATNGGNIGSKVALRTEDGTWVELASRNTGRYNNELTFTLESGDEIYIDSKIDSMQRTLSNGEKEFKLVVTAEAIQ